MGGTHAHPVQMAITGAVVIALIVSLVVPWRR